MQEGNKREVLNHRLVWPQLEGLVLLEPGVEEEDGGGAGDLVGDGAEEGEVVEGRAEGHGGKRPQHLRWRRSVGM